VTNTPLLVDTILFEYLAEVLCYVHLIAVLVDYDYLVRFFQLMNDAYFGKDYVTNSKDTNASSLGKIAAASLSTTTTAAAKIVKRYFANASVMSTAAGKTVAVKDAINSKDTSKQQQQK